MVSFLLLVILAADMLNAVHNTESTEEFGSQESLSSEGMMASLPPVEISQLGSRRLGLKASS